MIACHTVSLNTRKPCTLCGRNSVLLVAFHAVMQFCCVVSGKWPIRMSCDNGCDVDREAPFVKSTKLMAGHTSPLLLVSIRTSIFNSSIIFVLFIDNWNGYMNLWQPG